MSVSTVCVYINLPMPKLHWGEYLDLNHPRNAETDQRKILKATTLVTSQRSPTKLAQKQQTACEKNLSQKQQWHILSITTYKHNITEHVLSREKRTITIKVHYYFEPC